MSTVNDVVDTNTTNAKNIATILDNLSFISSANVQYITIKELLNI